MAERVKSRDGRLNANVAPSVKDEAKAIAEAYDLNFCAYVEAAIREKNLRERVKLRNLPPPIPAHQKGSPHDIAQRA